MQEAGDFAEKSPATHRYRNDDPDIIQHEGVIDGRHGMTANRSGLPHYTRANLLRRAMPLRVLTARPGREKLRYAAANTALRSAAGNVIVRKHILGYR